MLSHFPSHKKKIILLYVQATFKKGKYNVLPTQMFNKRNLSVLTYIEQALFLYVPGFDIYATGFTLDFKKVKWNHQ